MRVSSYIGDDHRLLTDEDFQQDSHFIFIYKIITLAKMKYTDRLLNDVHKLIKENDIPDGELYTKHIQDFFTQSPDEAIFQFATVSWDNDEKEFDFCWDTKLLDCRFSIGLNESRWHQWIGINNHSRDDECYIHGVGGDYYENKDFAYCFYEAMNWHIEEIKVDKPYFRIIDGMVYPRGLCPEENN